MAVVKMHQAKDGSLHKTAALCAAHNIQLRLAPAIDNFVEKLPLDTYVDANQVGPITSGLYIDLADIPAFLVKHSDQLRTLLNDALIERKPRKAKTEGETKPRRARPVKEAPAAEQKPVVEAKPEVPVNPPATVGDAPDPIDDVLAELGA